MTAYIPAFHCDRCNKPIPVENVKRVHKLDRGNQRRYLEVTCPSHNEMTQGTWFTDQPNLTVHVFGTGASSASAS